MPKKSKKKNKEKKMPERFYSTPESTAILGTPEGDRKNALYLEACRRIEEWKSKNSK